MVTWGDNDHGGDPSTVKAALIGVDAINSTYSAFAAVLKDRTVVTGGAKGAGGDSTTIQAALGGVKTIYSTDLTFAALSGTAYSRREGGNTLRISRMLM